ncbi:MAG: TIGR02530 family flagellar biosynthesis protein [Syntrophomonadaceae bacterium]
MNKIHLHYPVIPVPPPTQSVKPSLTDTDKGFKEILQSRLEKAEIKFSQHCVKRMEQNHIDLSPDQMNRLKNAVSKAKEKGSRESCIVMDNMAFVVSVDNRMVITVVDGERMKENVFTNIDSAVII